MTMKALNLGIFVVFQGRLTRTYYVGWIDKETLLNQIKQKSIKEQVWHQPPLMREFWTCKLRNEAKKPMELIEYIQNLK